MMIHRSLPDQFIQLQNLSLIPSKHIAQQIALLLP